MADVDERRAPGGRRQARLLRLFHQWRTEHVGPRRDPFAVALGVFIGCTPLFGLHLALSLLLAPILRVNRLKVYLAANISNPAVAPFLLFAEVQTGAWLRRGAVHPLTRDAIAAIRPWSFGLDLVVGAIAVGFGLAVALGALTFVALRRRDADPRFSALVTRAAERFAHTSFTAWEFANAKLRNDPVYRLVMNTTLLGGGDTLVDLGCGQGLTLSLLAEAREPERTPVHAGRADWPTYQRLIGIESRPRTARLAASALAGPGLDVMTGDARTIPLPPCDAVLLFDVLHMMPTDSQRTLMTTVAGALRPGGVVLVREADASAGWRFALIRLGNRLKAILGGHWRQPFTFRRPDEWVALFRNAGFTVDVYPGPTGHPFANTLYRLTRRTTSR